MKKILFLLSAVIILSACGLSKKSEKSTLRIGVMSSMDFLPISIAQKMGFFKEQGIDVEFKKFYSANDRDAAFQANAVDGCVIDYTGAVLQYAGGIELKLTSACNSTFCIMTASDNINATTDLKGKKVAVSRNTVIDFCVDMALASSGLSTDDVEKQEINKIPIRYEMMMNGKTDATALPDPFVSIAAKEGAKNLVCMSDLGYAVTGIIFAKKSIDDKKEDIQAFYKAYNRAVDYLHEHSIQDIRDVLINDIGFPEHLADSVQLPCYTHAQMPGEEDIRKVVEWLQSRQLIPADFDASNLSDNQFVVQ